MPSVKVQQMKRKTFMSRVEALKDKKEPESLKVVLIENVSFRGDKLCYDDFFYPLASLTTFWAILYSAYISKQQ